ncbi:glycosyltransferase family 4 protein [Bacillus alkalicellulosilyticus]|uniref:glycosyltransferase family 4 protein n=1 Tax=Alkalihalobacterium alkalicellulosilyticum TaxID=1912214 RepID=UPI0009985346|nr:MraY family glycosyltransferase [Bacillus alkalicellulosilyticus]
MVLDFIVAFCIAFSISLLLTPAVIKFAKHFKFMDKPNQRNVHITPIPRLGGVSIIVGAAIGFIYLSPQSDYISHIIAGALVIIVTGIVDDKYSLDAKIKLVLQLVAATIVVSSGLIIQSIHFPYIGDIQLGVFSYAITIIWIVAITNAINLIDGLDGLAGGVAIIALTTIVIMGIIDPANHAVVIGMSVILIGSTLAFLLFNFHPAMIFMGDTGALFLGYCIAIISILGLFKSVTLFSFVIPVIILAVPIFDTVFAIIRRILNQQKISTPDKGHLHHCLLEMGYSHRQTVFIVYGYSCFFGICAILFTNTALWTSLVFIVVMLLMIELYAEFIGLIGQRKPVTNAIKRMYTLREGLRK